VKTVLTAKPAKEEKSLKQMSLASPQCPLDLQQYFSVYFDLYKV